MDACWVHCHVVVLMGDAMVRLLMTRSRSCMLDEAKPSQRDSAQFIYSAWHQGIGG